MHWQRDASAGNPSLRTRVNGPYLKYLPADEGHFSAKETVASIIVPSVTVQVGRLTAFLQHLLFAIVVPHEVLTTPERVHGSGAGNEE